MVCDGGTPTEAVEKMSKSVETPGDCTVLLRQEIRETTEWDSEATNFPPRKPTDVELILMAVAEARGELKEGDADESTRTARHTSNTAPGGPPMRESRARRQRAPLSSEWGIQLIKEISMHQRVRAAAVCGIV